MDFSAKHCVPCAGGTIPLTIGQASEYLKAAPGWTLSADFKKISRQIIFKDFAAALHFINQLASIAESEGHHPNIHLTNWNHVTVELWTHAIGGLSENDFILAAKTNKIIQVVA